MTPSRFPRERLTETYLITLTKRVNSAAHRGQYAVVSPRSRRLEHNTRKMFKFFKFKFKFTLSAFTPTSTCSRRAGERFCRVARLT